VVQAKTKEWQRNPGRLVPLSGQTCHQLAERVTFLFLPRQIYNLPSSIYKTHDTQNKLAVNSELFVNPNELLGFKSASVVTVSHALEC